MCFGVCVSTDDQPEPIVGLSEVFLALLSEPSQLLRIVVHQSFEALCSVVSAPALDLLVQVLKGTATEGAEPDEDDGEHEGTDNSDAEAEADGNDGRQTVVPSRNKARPGARSVAQAADMAAPEVCCGA